MDAAYFLSLFAFTSSMTVTPGPNNIMLTASGVNFGYLRTLPHLVGIMFGVITMVLLVALGLGAIFVQWPITHTVLKVVGSMYLLYLAWKIATAGGIGKADASSKPMTFWQAALFQYVNPKAWTMAITGVSAFTLEGEQVMLSGIAIVAAFGIVSLPSCSFWVLLGTQIRHMLKNERAQKIFNYSLGGLTAACVVLILA